MGSDSKKRSLPEGWELTTIGDSCFRITKGSTPTSYGYSYQESGIRFVKTENINENGEIDTNTDYINDEANEYLKRSILSEDDILFSIAGTIGRVGIVRKNDLPANTNQALAIIRCPWEDIGNKYLFYYLKSPIIQKHAVNQVVGVGRANLSLTNIKEFPLYLAPLPEQRRIVAEIEKQFTRLDTAVASLKRAQANLERYKASVLKSACEGRLVPQDPDDESAEPLLQRILVERRKKWEEQEWQKQIERAQKKVAQARRKANGRPHYIRDLGPDEWQEIPEDEYARYLPKNDKWKEKYKEPEEAEMAELPELPTGWIWATTDMITSHVTSGSRGWAKFYSDEGSLFIRVGNFIRQNNRLDFSDVVFVNPMESAETDRTRLELNDVLVTITADVGMVGLVDETAFHWGDAYINQHVGLMRLVNSDLAPFISMAIASEGIQAQLREKQYGLTKSGLNLSDLRSLVVALPPTAEQQRIVDELERRLSVIAANEKAIAADLARAERLRQSILQQAFSGQLIPQENSGSQ